MMVAESSLCISSIKLNYPGLLYIIQYRELHLFSKLSYNENLFEIFTWRPLNEHSHQPVKPSVSCSTTLRISPRLKDSSSGVSATLSYNALEYNFWGCSKHENKKKNKVNENEAINDNNNNKNKQKQHQ